MTSKYVSKDYKLLQTATRKVFIAMFCNALRGMTFGVSTHIHNSELVFCYYGTMLKLKYSELSVQCRFPSREYFLQCAFEQHLHNDFKII